MELLSKKKDDYEDISSYSKRSNIKNKAENAKQRAKNKIDKKEKNNNNIKINAVQNIYNSLQKDEEICYGVSFGYAFCNRHFIITFIHNKDGSK